MPKSKAYRPKMILLNMTNNFEENIETYKFSSKRKDMPK